MKKEGVWGQCHRNAPVPYLLGPTAQTFNADWQKVIQVYTKAKSEGGNPDWTPPFAWRTLWPDTSETDSCGQWKRKDR